MKCKVFLMLVFAFLFLPGWTGAVSEKDFEVQTTQELLNLCTASPSDPLYPQPVNFCSGCLAGAYKYIDCYMEAIRISNDTECLKIRSTKSDFEFSCLSPPLGG